jgi:NAD(P)H-binding
MAAAVQGAEVIVHCAGSSKGDEQKTRALVSAANHAGHIVLISVVGADRIPQASAVDRALFGYFGMKLATERVVEQSGIGWTTLRATQFHDLILMVTRALAKLPVLPASTGSRFQPVDATEVAEQMAGLALGEPAGLVPDLAGSSGLRLSWPLIGSRSQGSRLVGGGRILQAPARPGARLRGALASRARQLRGRVMTPCRMKWNGPAAACGPSGRPRCPGWSGWASRPPCGGRGYSVRDLLLRPLPPADSGEVAGTRRFRGCVIGGRRGRSVTGRAPRAGTPAGSPAR